MSVTIAFLTGNNVTVPLIEGSVREFCLHCAKFITGEPVIIDNGNTFLFGLHHNGVKINTFENRHKEISEFLKAGDVIRATRWYLGGPFNTKMFKYNLLESNLERDSCAICLDEFNEKAEYDAVLDCGHKFHFRCLAKLKENKCLCPICSKSINSKIMLHIKACVNSPLYTEDIKL